MNAAFTWHGDGVLSKVRKRDGRRVFYIQYWYGGRRLTEKVGFKEQTARGLVEARRRQIDEDPSYVPPIVRKRAERRQERRDPLFRDFAEEFRSTWASTRISSSTFFRPMIAQLVREFGEFRLGEITRQRVEQFLARRVREVKASTANHSLRFTKNMLERAVKWGYLKENVAKGITPLREGPPREMFLSQEESDLLLENAQQHVRPILQTALLTGMRRGEILALEWSQVDIPGRRIHLRQTKNGKARVVPMGKDLVELLARTPRRLTTPRAFTYEGRPLKSLQGSWETARARLVAAVLETGSAARAEELEGLHFHDLRHTWASRQVAGGCDIYTLMKLGGWSSIAMVQRYAHFSPDFLQAAAERMDGTAGVGVAPGVVGPCGKEGAHAFAG